MFASRDLDSRNNSLNLIRLVLAWSVLVSHGMILAGVGDGLVWQGENLGGWAVIGFFGISGFLITGSRMRTDGGRYLINRVVRIFPGYILSLIVVAFVFAPTAYFVEKGSLEGFLSTPNTPANYVFSNLFLRVFDYSVAGTLASVPYPSVWNGSLWSLYFEFWCYIIIGVFLSWKYVRTRVWPVALLFVLSVLAQAKIDMLSGYLGGNTDFVLLVKMIPFFLGGSLMYFVRSKIPLRWDLALLTLLVSIAVIFWIPGFGKQLAAPLLAYLVLWVGALVPSPGVVRVHDISYGTYIFAFPITQLLVLLGAAHFGFWWLITLASGATLVAATLSWLFVERAVMRWSRGNKPWGDLRSAAR